MLLFLTFYVMKNRFLHLDLVYGVINLISVIPAETEFITTNYLLGMLCLSLNPLSPVHPI